MIRLQKVHVVVTWSHIDDYLWVLFSSNLSYNHIMSLLHLGYECRHIYYMSMHHVYAYASFSWYCSLHACKLDIQWRWPQVSWKTQKTRSRAGNVTRGIKADTSREGGRVQISCRNATPDPVVVSCNQNHRIRRYHTVHDARSEIFS